ncbi:hypothetical protein KAR91_11715 [Candidatus Pacearchaeota archaeon]|nr:hypothetical protein [Candidatus Pacearchaeota archaeon]
MTTYNDLKDQIADDLNRSDLTSQIEAGIANSVALYNQSRWWFNEGRAFISASASQAYYAVPSDMLDKDTMLVTIGGSKEPLVEKSYEEIDNKDTDTYVGTPAEFCYFADQFRLYPKPNTGFTLTLSFHKVLDPPTASASNAWTNRYIGFNLIRHATVREIAMHKMNAPNKAALASAGEKNALTALTTLNTKRMTRGRVTPTEF